MRKRRKPKATSQHVYSGSNQTNAETDLSSFRTDKDDQAYSNAYATFRESNEYSEIVQEKRNSHGSKRITPFQSENHSAFDKRSPHSSTADNGRSVPVAHECVELVENYTEPDDSIVMKKPKLKNVNSSHSYTYPYDSLDRLTDHRKTKSAI